MVHIKNPHKGPGFLNQVPPLASYAKFQKARPKPVLHIARACWCFHSHGAIDNYRCLESLPKGSEVITYIVECSRSAAPAELQGLPEGSGVVSQGDVHRRTEEDGAVSQCEPSTLVSTWAFFANAGRPEIGWCHNLLFPVLGVVGSLEREG